MWFSDLLKIREPCMFPKVVHEKISVFGKFLVNSRIGYILGTQKYNHYRYQKNSNKELKHQRIQVSRSYVRHFGDRTT